MKSKWLTRVLLVIFAGIFLFAAWNLFGIWQEYREGEETYDKTVEEFVTTLVPQEGDSSTASSGVAQEEEEELAIRVDFESLLTVNKDVVGWLYSPDTPINYPVVQGSDNDYYLNHLYDGTYNSAGSLFVDYQNSAGFSDANVLVYGHHMKNRTMFNTLQEYKSQAYYEAHPIMWLLTPTQNYKVILFSAYTTGAVSETYTMFSAAGQPLYDYLEQCKAQSDFSMEIDLRSYNQFVVFSTCAYDFDDARYVVHGALEPVDTTPLS